MVTGLRSDLLDPYNTCSYQDIISNWNTFLSSMEVPVSIPVPFTSLQAMTYLGSADSFILVTKHSSHKWPTSSGYYNLIFHLWVSVAFQCWGPMLVIVIRMRNTGLLSTYWVLLIPLDRHQVSLILSTTTSLAALGSQFLLPIDNSTCNMFKLTSFSCKNWLAPDLAPISEVN